MSTSGLAGDTLGVTSALGALAARLERAVSRARDVTLPAVPARDITVIGAGGGAVAAGLVAAVTQPVCPVPIVVHEHAVLPGHVGHGSLVLVTSVTSGAPEVVAAADAAVRAGATVVGLVPDGALGRALEAAGAPVVPIDALPTGRLGAFEVAVVLGDLLGRGAPSLARLLDPAPVLAAIEQRLTDDARLGSADELARRIGRAIPIVQGVGPVGGAAARWWKHEINLSAKVPCWWGVVPSVGHDEVAGWGQHGDITRQVLHLVTLRHDHEDPGDGAALEQLDAWQLEVVGGLHEVRASGASVLAQGMDLALTGALVASRIALRNDVDPGPAPVADRFS